MAKFQMPKGGYAQEAVDRRFVLEADFEDETKPGPSRSLDGRHEESDRQSDREEANETGDDGEWGGVGDAEVDEEYRDDDREKSRERNNGSDVAAETAYTVSNEDADNDGEEGSLLTGMDPAGFIGPTEKTVKPLTTEALAAFNAKQARTGVIYISRIPPGMRPTKVRHLMSAYGEVGRVYLQPEDPKRSYLRRKYTSTKKVHFTEGWVEFTDKRVARSVAGLLNAQPIGGKKGNRWRDDVWTMKYLPRFKWNMLTEQIAHEAAVHTARLRVELEQSRKEQRDYLQQVELARVLDKRAERKRKALEAKGEDIKPETLLPTPKKPRHLDAAAEGHQRSKRTKEKEQNTNRAEDVPGQLSNVLGSVF